MNILLLHPAEVHAGTPVRVEGSRYSRLLDGGGYTVGERIRVGQIEGPRGWGTIRVLARGHCEVAIEELKEPSRSSSIDLICGVCRPQMMKRVLQFAGCVSIDRVMFVRTAQAEKSYCFSSVLDSASVQENLMIGMEQGGGTRLPKVSLFQRFRPFVEDKLLAVTSSRGALLFGDPLAQKSTWHLLRESTWHQNGKQGGGVICVGGERGFTEFERGMLVEGGFSAVSLGDGILRVDTAVTFLFAQAEMLLALSGGAAFAGEQSRSGNGF